jgi:hypothetical protein
MGVGKDGLAKDGQDALGAALSQARSEESAQEDLATIRARMSKLASVAAALRALEVSVSVDDAGFEALRPVAVAALGALSTVDAQTVKVAVAEAFDKALKDGRQEALRWLAQQNLPPFPLAAADDPNAGPWTVKKLAQARWTSGLDLMSWTARACREPKPASFLALEELGFGQLDREGVYKGLAQELGGLGAPLAIDALSRHHPWVALLCAEGVESDPLLEAALELWRPPAGVEGDCVWEALELRACSEGSRLALARLAEARRDAAPSTSLAAVQAACQLLSEPEDDERWEGEAVPELAALSRWFASANVCDPEAVAARLMEDLFEAVHQFPAYWAFDDASRSAKALRRLAAWPSRPPSAGWGACPAAVWGEVSGRCGIEASALMADGGDVGSSQSRAFEQLQALSGEASSWSAAPRKASKRM